MSDMSYLSSLENYQEYRHAIRELLASILTGIGQSRLFHDQKAMCEAICHMAEHYPFVELLYTLDEHGKQTSDTIGCNGRGGIAILPGKNEDRSQRPYYQLASESKAVVVTEPYLSSANRKLCISAALKWQDADGKITGYVVVDIGLADTLEFLMGDTLRRRFLPAFRTVYSIIVFGLFCVVGILLFSAFYEISTLFQHNADVASFHLKPFGVIIFLTLGLAVFDLGKTVLEEEVLMHKDIFRHSSTRRTITRFIAAILIAVSIEALLMMFKAALGEGEEIQSAVWMMLTAVGLLVGLGVYVNLGSKAEVRLLSYKAMNKS